MTRPAPKALYLEPFEGGSHAAFTRTLTRGLPLDWTVLTLPARHWKWRMRGAAAYFALAEGPALAAGHDLIVASAYLPLHELYGLCPALRTVPALLYFHENQLTFPQRAAHSGPRDLHFGTTQLVAGLAARICAFNSEHNRSSFLGAGRELLARLPDAQPPGWIETLEARSRVLPLPLDLAPIEAALPECTDLPPGPARARGPLLLWNHRWEHDKGPEALFAVLEQLAARDVPFRVAVCGQTFRTVPPVFAAARERLGERVEHWGYAASGAAYRALLGRAQIALSTAEHEFFGVSMLEATHAGALPLVPDRLAYPELFPPELRYRDDEDLVARLETLCRDWTAGRCDLRGDRRALSGRYRAATVLPRYASLVEELMLGRPA